MKRNIVYTLTFHEVLNVGAVLQAYALQKFLKSQGHETSILNYRPAYFLWQIYRPAKSLTRTISKIRQIIKFSKFRKRHLKITKQSFSNLAGLRKFTDCTAIVCGSDQIWNYKLTGSKYDPVYFLGMPATYRKIAYGASCGGHTLSLDRELVEPMLKGFNAIGTREESLKNDLVNNEIFADALTVVDPTFLIRDYSDLFDQTVVPSGQEYIATYEVSDPSTRLDFEAKVRLVKERLNLPVIHLGAKPIKGADRVISDISPGQWLALIAKAQMVCTNSFHGVALSLNLRRGLVFIPHLDSEKNVRALDLLSRINLEQLVYSDEREEYRTHREYSTKILDQRIMESKSFLIEALI